MTCIANYYYQIFRSNYKHFSSINYYFYSLYNTDEYYIVLYYSDFFFLSYEIHSPRVVRDSHLYNITRADRPALYIISGSRVS